MVKYKGLDEVKDTPLFANCKPYIEAFNSYGEQYNIPPIFLASISMQESSCQPDVTGGGGEVGL